VDEVSTFEEAVELINARFVGGAWVYAAGLSKVCSLAYQNIMQRAARNKPFRPLFLQ
jgi:hypothetical protein